VVFRGHDEVLHRPVAIKVLRHSTAAAPAASTLIDEARLLASVPSPYVVAIHDVGGDDDGIWMILEWVDGMDAARWVHQPRAPHWR
jgi:serine/threonine protein kinase